MRWTALKRNAMLDAVRTSANSGLLRIYDGTRPANGDAALSGNTLLATCTMNATAFPAASGGVLTANAITSGTAVATSTPTFARLFQSDGTTVICDFSVTITGGGGEVQFPSLSFSVGLTVGLTTCTLTIPVGA